MESGWLCPRLADKDKWASEVSFVEGITLLTMTKWAAVGGNEFPRSGMITCMCRVTFYKTVFGFMVPEGLAGDHFIKGHSPLSASGPFPVLAVTFQHSGAQFLFQSSQGTCLYHSPVPQCGLCPFRLQFFKGENFAEFCDS